MELTVIALGAFLVGLMLGIFFMWRFYYPSFLYLLKESSEEIYKLYKDKRENCPAYLIKRAKSIAESQSFRTSQEIIFKSRT